MGKCEWHKASWRGFPICQQPQWPDERECSNVVDKLSQLPALVFAGETRRLMGHLGRVAEGKAFVLQCGDCSEEFAGCNGPRIHRLLKVILQMAIVLAYAGEKEIITIGRVAGQYAKPRSSETEKFDMLEIPSYRGDMINSPEPTIEARLHNPKRMLEGYFRSTATLNLIRAFTRGGYAALDYVESWHRDFCGAFPANRKYDDMVKGIRKAINFAAAIGLDFNSTQFNQFVIYTSHEALLLDYEEAMTRIDTTTGDWYDTSAHMLWVGDRTRHPDGAHVEFLRGVGNPIGIKIGPNHNLNDIIRVIELLNPQNHAGRISLITRFGAGQIGEFLPSLIRKMEGLGFKVAWICDPMHGNTYKNANGHKTRKFDDIVKEINNFVEIHKSEGTIAGGVHLELTGENVTECVGGTRHLSDKDLCLNYQTTCDPRLNAEQAVELAFELAEMINP
jgi:3-deoxy-7-phosphoheptulonate synthase